MSMNETLIQFVNQVRALGSVDFPDVARGMGFNWFRDIKPELDKNPEFRALLEEVLGEIKYELYQCILKIGKDGKKRNGRDPEITYINAIIKHIDTGALLGKSTESIAQGLSPEQERVHLLRLGYDEEQIRRIQAGAKGE